MADTDPLAAKLAGIKAETAVSGPRPDDMHRLLVFADEVLELHVEGPYRDCADCGRAFPCPTVRAATRALLGAIEGGSGG